MQKSNSVISLQSVKKKIVREKYANKIFKYQDVIEYCLVDDYEKEYLNYGYHSIAIEFGFWKEVVLLEKGDHIVLSSINFNQKFYSAENVLDWLESNNVEFIKATTQQERFVIKKASEISKVLLYKGNLIVNYVPGKKEIIIKKSDYNEVTEDFIPMHRIVNTKDAENIFYED